MEAIVPRPSKGLCNKWWGADREWGQGQNHASMPDFFSLQVAMFFLIFFIAITSCTKSMSEQSEAESMIHTSNHSAKDSKKTKQLLTEML